MALSEQQKNEIKELILETLQPKVDEFNTTIDEIEKTLASFGGDEFTNLSTFGKPMELARSMRLLAYTPAQLTAAANDYDTGDFPVLRVSSDASRNITGFKNGYNGRLLLVINVGANNIVLKDADTNSVAANRIATGVGDITLVTKMGALLWYDIVSLRWRAWQTTV